MRLSAYIQILDELYTRTHIPCLLINENRQPIYPKIPIAVFQSIVTEEIFQVAPETIHILVEEQQVAYGLFPFTAENATYYVLTACLLNTLSSKEGPEIPKRWSAVLSPTLIHCHVAQEYLSAFQSYNKMLYLSFTHRAIQESSVSVTYLTSVKSAIQEDGLTLRKLAQNSRDFYYWEQSFFTAFEKGEIHQLYSLLDELSLYDIDGVENKLEDIKYKYVAFITLVTRSVIKNGAAYDLAFALSDKYLANIQQASSMRQVSLLLKESITDFYNLRQKIANNYSLNVVKALQYVETHLYDKISLQDISEAINISSSYLSSMFKKETGTTITQYIWQKKTEEAKRLLLFTEKSYSEISSLLNFNSQSNFIQIFKRISGLTPKKYQSLHRMNY